MGKWVLRITGGLGRLWTDQEREGYRPWGQLIFSATTATLRDGQGQAGQGQFKQRRKNKNKKKDTNGKWQQDRVFSALVNWMYIKDRGVASRRTQADRMEAVTKQHKSIHDIIIWFSHLIACPNENLCMLPHSHFVDTTQVNKQA